MAQAVTVIDERKTKAVRALMSGVPMTKAAEMAGVSRQTIWH